MYAANAHAAQSTQASGARTSRIGACTHQDPAFDQSFLYDNLAHLQLRDPAAAKRVDLHSDGVLDLHFVRNVAMVCLPLG